MNSQVLLQRLIMSAAFTFCTFLAHPKSARLLQRQKHQGRKKIGCLHNGKFFNSTVINQQLSTYSLCSKNYVVLWFVLQSCCLSRAEKSSFQRSVAHVFLIFDPKNIFSGTKAKKVVSFVVSDPLWSYRLVHHFTDFLPTLSCLHSYE